MSFYGAFQVFTRITAWPLERICLRSRYYYRDKTVQSRRVRGPAIIVSNHTSVFDFAALLFAFPTCTLRCLMAELLFEKKPLCYLLRAIGGIYIDRNAYSTGGVSRAEVILRRGGVIGVFPEGRIPEDTEKKPLAFRSGAAYLALAAGVPVIPVYVDGQYFNKKHTRVMIGTPVYLSGEATVENLTVLSEDLRQQVIDLGRRLENV